MDRLYAFIDESGAFGGDTRNPSVSKYFIVTAIILKKEDLKNAKLCTEQICKQNFGTSEMKSSGIGSNSKRRLKILNELNAIPYKYFSLVVDKEKLTSYRFPGLKYKKSFYKFLNNIIYCELRKTFPLIDITADSTGSTGFSESFLKYMKTKIDPGNLFEDQNIYLHDSKTDILIQIADIVSGTLSYIYDERKQDSQKKNYEDLLESHKLKVEFYPKDYRDFNIYESALATEYEPDIAEICFHSAKEFLNLYESSSDDDVKIQIEVVEYLLFRFINNNQRNYISTKEIIDFLNNIGYEEISKYYFRTKIIGKLRDFGVIIASSSKGYKIPTCKQDLLDFVEHNNSIILPMVYRLKKCCDKIYIGTMKETDLLESPKYNKLKQICNILDLENKYMDSFE